MHFKYKIILAVVLLSSLVVFANVEFTPPESSLKTYGKIKKPPKLKLPDFDVSEPEVSEKISQSTSISQPKPTKPATPHPSLPSKEQTNPFDGLEPFDPTQREQFEQAQKEVQQYLDQEPQQYPYEFDPELDRLRSQVEKGNATRKEQNAYMLKSIQFGQNKSASKVDADAKTKPVNAYPKNASQNPLYQTVGSDFSESAAQSEEAQVQKFKEVQYQPGSNPIPKELAYTHQHLKIYQVIPGQHASAQVVILGQLDPPAYLQKPDHEPYWHNHYRIGPDFDVHWTFGDSNQPDAIDPHETAKALQAADQHLYSLGIGGSITFEITQGALINREGADFVIWSNPFCVKYQAKSDQKIDAQEIIPHHGDARSVQDTAVQCFTELAKVEVSEEGPDGSFVAFDPCPSKNKQQSHCAGYGLNLWKYNQDPFDPRSGGDRYDLSDLTPAKDVIRAIRITDMHIPAQVKAQIKTDQLLLNGFDLDAIAILHYEGEQR